MNKARREQIAFATGKVEQAKALLEEAKDIFDDAMSEEQGYYDSMPEPIQAGVKGDETQSRIDALQTVVEDLDSLIGNSEWDAIEAHSEEGSA